MKIKITQDRFAEHVKATIESCDSDKKKWLAKFEADAATALSWSDLMFEVCAKEAVYKEISEALENNVTVADIVDYTYKEVLNQARFPSSSTSSGHNKMEVAFLKAKSEMLSVMCSY
jgi:hypothetical protein